MRKLNIFFDFVDGPWGGGNQFLKALRQEWIAAGIYEADPHLADGILFNSHHKLIDVLKLKRRYPGKVFIHRIDGPMFLQRDAGLAWDRFIFLCNRVLADGTIFQSSWSNDRGRQAGLCVAGQETIIINAPDSSVFFAKKGSRKEGKCRLVALSWSSNPKKGFSLLDFLDRNLDFSRYEMTFIGRAPIVFRNIIHQMPLSGARLADKLREQDIIVAVSSNDPCSNALLEGLHCGLPAVALNSGGHPEIVQSAGAMFVGEENILAQIDAVAANVSLFRERIALPSIRDVSRSYSQFFETVATNKERSGVAISDYLYVRVKRLALGI